MKSLFLKIPWLPLLLAGLLTGKEARAQDTLLTEWAPIGAKWHYDATRFYPPMDPIVYYTMEAIKDTVVQGKNLRYVILKNYAANGTVGYGANGYQGGIFLYQDNKKLYISRASATPNYKLLYDFGLAVGDTYHFGNGQEPATNCELKVLETGVKEVNGLQRRYQKITAVTAEWNSEDADGISEVIEGIGSLDYLIPAPDGIASGQFMKGIRCYEEVGFSISYLPDGKTCEVPLSTSEFVEPLALSVFPNPTHDNVNLTFQGLGDVKIYDAVGKSYFSGRFYKNGTINLSDAPNGVYFISVQTAERTYFKKFIKNNS